MHCSDAEIQALQPGVKLYKVFFGHGLYIQVNPSGSKYWRMKYRLGGKEGTYSIGVFPEVSAPEAVKAQQHARRLVRQGENPTSVRHNTEKLKEKSPSKKAFSLTLSLDGALAIETDTKLVKLTSLQTKALREFLAVESKAIWDSQPC